MLNNVFKFTKTQTILIYMSSKLLVTKSFVTSSCVYLPFHHKGWPPHWTLDVHSHVQHKNNVCYYPHHDYPMSCRSQKHASWTKGQETMHHGPNSKRTALQMPLISTPQSSHSYARLACPKTSHFVFENGVVLRVQHLVPNGLESLYHRMSIVVGVILVERCEFKENYT